MWLKSVIFLLLLVPILLLGQEKVSVITSGPPNIRQYIVNRKHDHDSMVRKQEAEGRLKSFFCGYVYVLHDQSLVIFQGEGPEVLVTHCGRDSTRRVPFVNFAAKKAILFFNMAFFLPCLRETQLINSH